MVKQKEKGGRDGRKDVEDGLSSSLIHSFVFFVFLPFALDYLFQQVSLFELSSTGSVSAMLFWLPACW